jgi:hypothetical protein
MDQDSKQLAIYLSRARAVIGLSMIVAPGLLGRAWMGPGGSTGPARALARIAGIRDLVLGIGAMTALNEGDHGPEWLSMAAASDAVDAVTLLLGRGLPLRARLSSLTAAAAAAAGMKLSRDLADEREAALSVS